MPNQRVCRMRLFSWVTTLDAFLRPTSIMNQSFAESNGHWSGTFKCSPDARIRTGPVYFQKKVRYQWPMPDPNDRRNTKVVLRVEFCAIRVGLERVRMAQWITWHFYQYVNFGFKTKSSLLLCFEIVFCQIMSQIWSPTASYKEEITPWCNFFLLCCIS